MFKQVITLFRGTANEAVQDFTDRHSLTILRQQIHDAGRTVEAARKAVAIAIAQNKQEQNQYDKLVERIRDLESRTLIALEKGEDEVAHQAAEAIAMLENERDTSKQAIDRFKVEIERLRKRVHESESRLRQLKHGLRIADATDKTQRIRDVEPVKTASSLDEAEETLLRLRVRQQQIDATAEVMEEMATEATSEQIIEKLAEKGCGDKLRTGADDVLERLRKAKPRPAKTSSEKTKTDKS